MVKLPPTAMPPATVRGAAGEPASTLKTHDLGFDCRLGLTIAESRLGTNPYRRHDHRPHRDGSIVRDDRV